MGKGSMGVCVQIGELEKVLAVKSVVLAGSTLGSAAGLAARRVREIDAIVKGRVCFELGLTGDGEVAVVR